MLRRSSPSSSSPPPSTSAPSAPSTRPARAVWKVRKLPPPPSALALRRLRERLGRARRTLAELARDLRPFNPSGALDAGRALVAEAAARAALHLEEAAALPASEVLAARWHCMQARLAVMDAREARADVRTLRFLVATIARCRAVLVSVAASHVARLARDVTLTAGSLTRAARCGARTRTGGSCRAPCVEGRRRCKLHGGRSTGPKSAEGKARALAALATVNARRRGSTPTAVVQDCASKRGRTTAPRGAEGNCPQLSL